MTTPSQALLPADILYPAYDCTWPNVKNLPKDAKYVLGYTTGSADVRWQNFHQFPDGGKIDQSDVPGTWDGFADIQDYEKSAVTLGELPSRIRSMRHSFDNGLRPGQREPAIYLGNRDHATEVVNTLIASGIDSGVNLAVAAPDLPLETAIQWMKNSIGTPWPIVWVQNVWGQQFDTGIIYKPWWEKVSVRPKPKTQFENIKNITASQLSGEIHLDITMMDGSKGPFAIPIPSWTWHS